MSTPLDVERLARECGATGGDHMIICRADLAEFSRRLLEEAAIQCDTVAWSHRNAEYVGPELNAAKCAGRIRALKPKEQP
jgi:hypothetical protein